MATFQEYSFSFLLKKSIHIIITYPITDNLYNCILKHISQDLGFILMQNLYMFINLKDP